MSNKLTINFKKTNAILFSNSLMQQKKQIQSDSWEYGWILN